ncbi:MAG: lipopolysaccharide biosynthesis protein [Acholeplasmataceae bacterium]|nr:lipopolysaccharide biosynthesis protein [Acholeplasmataceae bacterium]
MDQTQSLKNATITGFIWRLSQNFGTQFINFGIQIVLARILLPETYGIIALTAIFSAIANVLIQGAFSSSIVQRKKITDLELSSVFYLSVMLSLVFFGMMFAVSPFVANFYNEPLLEAVLRVQAINIVIGSLYTVHQSLMIRHMQYKKGFFSGLAGTIAQGVIGITLALNGYGVWALVFSTLANNIITSLIVIMLVKWKPKLEFSLSSVKSLFDYGSKIFIINFMNAIYTNLLSLFIGKIYDSERLGYYNKGYSFPVLIMINVDGAINTVLFSSLSKMQDDPEGGLKVLRRSMKMSMFLSAPAMLGLVAVAEPMISFLLTDKWLPSVPFLRIIALGCLIWPLSARMQAINAIGRSDVALKLNIALRVIGVIFIIIFSRFNIYVLVLSTIVGEFIIAVILSFVIDKMIGYKVKDQLMDILPSLALAGFMAVIVWSITLLNLSDLITLTTQLFSGAMLYLAFALLFKMESLTYLIQTAKSMLRKKG